MIKSKLQYRKAIQGKVFTFYGDSKEEIADHVVDMTFRITEVMPDKIEIIKQVSKLIGDVPKTIGAPTTIQKRRSISLKDAARAATALIKVSTGGSVELNEYRRRSEICSKCTFKSKVSDCMGCGGAGKAARFMMSFRSKLGLGYKTDSAISSQFCVMCGCSLSLLLVTKVSNYKYEDDKENNKRPSHCWLRRTSTNFNGI